MILENGPLIVGLIVGFIAPFIALYVYKETKRNEKKNAATIVVMDIRHAEQVVLSILEKNTVDMWTKEVLFENNWSKYKHLFVSDFSYDDFAMINQFFDSCMEMSHARRRLREIFSANLDEKARIFQQKILNVESPESASGQILKQQIIDKINRETKTFDPDEPKTRILQNLNVMRLLSGTVAFEKLRKLAGSKL